MDARIQKKLEKFLMDNGYYYTEEVEVENNEDVQVLGGKRYLKESVDLFKFHNDPLFLKELPDGYTPTKKETRNIVDMNDANDIEFLLRLENSRNILEILNELRAKKEYKVLSYIDNRKGATNTNTIENDLNICAQEGWRVISITTNQIYDVEYLSSATVDQTIIVLERTMVNTSIDDV